MSLDPSLETLNFFSQMKIVFSHGYPLMIRANLPNISILSGSL